MRLAIAAILIAAAAWSGWWWVGSGREVAAVRAWFEERPETRADAVSIAGFPNRFDTQIDAPELRIGDLTWSAPFVQLMRLSYRPGHYIVAVADSQTVATPTQTVEMTTEDSRASVVYTGSRPDRLSVVIDTPRLSSSAGWNANAETLLIAMRASGEEGIEVGLDITALSRPEARAVSLHAEGVLSPGTDGRPSGTIRVHSTDWPVALTLLDDIGWLTAEQASAAEEKAEADEPLHLELSDGRMTLAGIDLGALPGFRLR